MFFNPYINSEEEEFFNSVYDFAREKILPGSDERDEKALWSSELWGEMGQMGLNGIAIPEEHGGQGASCLQCCQASEALNLGAQDGGLILAWGAHTIIGTMPIVLFGTDEQKKKYLPGLASGKLIAGLGLTEPGSGSDAAGLTTTAKDAGDHWVLNGTKMFITNGPIGDVFIVMARTKEGASRGPMGISAFIVEKNHPGFSVGKVLKKLGMHTSTTSELIFEDMKVPKENLLGPLHSGFMRIGRATLEWERTVLVSATLGSAGFCLETALKYASTRQQFGKPILEFPAIQEKLARSWAFLNAARRYVYYVASSKDKEIPMPMQASILKLLVTEQMEEISHEMVQVLGGYGFMREYHVERFYRDVKLGTIGAGSSEVMRNIVASSFPGFEKFKDSMKSMYPDDIRTKAEVQYTEDTYGELRVLKAIENLVESAAKTVKKSSHQAVAFAFADAITIYSALQQGFWDTANEYPTYSVEDRKRDLAIACNVYVGKYARSLRMLGSVDQAAVNELFAAFLELKGIEERVSECIDYLKKGMGIEEPVLVGK